MDFHSMFEEMHAAMAEMMDVRRSMVDRMFGGFGPSVFPGFSSLREDFERDFYRDFAFPRFPRLMEYGSSAVPAVGASRAAGQQQPPQPSKQPQPTKEAGSTASAPAAVGSSVMYSTQQCYNSADPSKNYSRHTTTQAGPGGVLESRTAVLDNGEERVEVRRQVGDRYTHVTRKRRLDTGEETVEKRSQNLLSEETAPFEEEWSRLAKEFLPMYRSAAQAQPQEAAALGEPPKAAQAESALPARNAPGAQAQAQAAALQK